MEGDFLLQKDMNGLTVMDSDALPHQVLAALPQDACAQLRCAELIARNAFAIQVRLRWANWARSEQEHALEAIVCRFRGHPE